MSDQLDTPFRRDYYASGTLRVAARGYWFTAGGEKGSFGYYPHLKDENALPIFPDTEIHGDLKMAAQWLHNLSKDTFGTLSPDSIFGLGGGDHLQTTSTRSHFFPGDLELSNDSRTKWHDDRYTIKPRIQIDDDTRTVDEHFLVILELSYLEEMTLEAPIILGPFASVEEQGSSKRIIESIIHLLSGFGAFRSRGYGRGGITVVWNDRPPTNKVESLEDIALISLQALTHVRNRPIEPGSPQSIETAMSITPAQFKAWLAKTYNNNFREWPTPEQMASIKITPMYPSPAEGTRTFHPAMSTLKNEKGEIHDCYETNAEKVQQEEMDGEGENFFSYKTKPLGPTWFVTERNKAYEFPTRRRVRNSIDNKKFTTKEAGLFVQEYLPRETLFCGQISLRGCDPLLSERVTKILQSTLPIINGTIFTICLSKDNTKRAASGPFLVVDTIPYHAGYKDTVNAISLSTLRQYNTSLKRPRRPQPVIMPGSILKEIFKEILPEAIVDWKGFGGPIATVGSPKQEKDEKEDSIKKQPDITADMKQQLKKLTRSQAGQLREMLHPKLDETFLCNHLVHRIEKYKGNQKSYGFLEFILRRIQTELTEGGRDRMKEYIGSLLEEYSLIQWEKKQKGEEI